MRKLLGLAALVTALSSAAPSLAAVSLDQIKAAEIKLAKEAADADLRAAPPPRLSNVSDAALIRTAFDADTLTNSSISLSDAADLCRAATKAEYGYILHGLKRSGIDPKASKSEIAQKLILLESSNGMTYQDEVTLAVRFSIVCDAKSIPALQTFLATLPPEQMTDARKQALVMMRTGFLELFEATALTQAEPWRAANRDVVLNEALRWADVYAAAMPPQDRAMVIAVIDKVGRTAGLADATQEKLHRLRAVFQRTDCTGLCALSAG
ncbi:MAG TPA: hypothetical protein VG407_06305 [Caulobacteraceae bacterium]|jgi:hypothetical protein|nr:hypothetical protein [Caulobacteraceae bacterium]